MNTEHKTETTRRPPLLHKFVNVERYKADDKDNGGFSGYGAVFGNVDLGGDRIVRGAFAKHLDAFIRDGWIAEGHDWQGLGIGYIRDAKEDDYGLLIDVGYYASDDAQRIRRKVADRIDNGKTVGLSIGYYLHDARASAEAFDLLEIEVKETSIVTVPMNPLAGIASAKGVTTLQSEVRILEYGIDQHLQRLKERAELREREAIARGEKDGRTLSGETLGVLYSHADEVDNVCKTLAESSKRLREFARKYDRATSIDEDKARVELERIKYDYFNTINKGHQ